MRQSQSVSCNILFMFCCCNNSLLIRDLEKQQNFTCSSLKQTVLLGRTDGCMRHGNACKSAAGVQKEGHVVHYGTAESHPFCGVCPLHYFVLSTLSFFFLIYFLLPMRHVPGGRRPRYLRLIDHLSLCKLLRERRGGIPVP